MISPNERFYERLYTASAGSSNVDRALDILSHGLSRNDSLGWLIRSDKFTTDEITLALNAYDIKLALEANNDRCAGQNIPLGGYDR